MPGRGKENRKEVSAVSYQLSGTQEHKGNTALQEFKNGVSVN
jgi:hypothetical protein